MEEFEIYWNNKIFLQFKMLNWLMDFWKPDNQFCQKQGFVSRKNWYCQMNVETYRGIPNVLLCIFALSMQVAAFWSHNLSRSLARKKLWFNMISTRNWILKCQYNQSGLKMWRSFKSCILGEFRTNGSIVQDQWFDSYIIITTTGASSVDR